MKFIGKIFAAVFLALVLVPMSSFGVSPDTGQLGRLRDAYCKAEDGKITSTFECNGTNFFGCGVYKENYDADGSFGKNNAILNAACTNPKMFTNYDSIEWNGNLMTGTKCGEGYHHPMLKKNVGDYSNFICMSDSTDEVYSVYVKAVQKRFEKPVVEMVKKFTEECNKEGPLEINEAVNFAPDKNWRNNLEQGAADIVLTAYNKCVARCKANINDVTHITDISFSVSDGNYKCTSPKCDKDSEYPDYDSDLGKCMPRKSHSAGAGQGDTLVGAGAGAGGNGNTITLSGPSKTRELIKAAHEKLKRGEKFEPVKYPKDHKKNGGVKDDIEQLKEECEKKGFVFEEKPKGKDNIISCSLPLTQQTETEDENKNEGLVEYTGFVYIYGTSTPIPNAQITNGCRTYSYGVNKGYFKCSLNTANVTVTAKGYESAQGITLKEGKRNKIYLKPTKTDNDDEEDVTETVPMKSYPVRLIDEQGKEITPDKVDKIEIPSGCSYSSNKIICPESIKTPKITVKLKNGDKAEIILPETPGSEPITITPTGSNINGQSGDGNNEEYKGKVVDEKGKPVKGVEVIPGCGKTDKNGLFNCGINPTNPQYDINISGYKPAKGKLTPGDNTITLTHTEPNGMPGGTKEQGGDEEGQGDDNNEEYKGKVVDEKEKPVKGIEVIPGCGKTDKNGLFNCGINPTNPQYDININGYKPAKGKLTPGDNTITLTHTDPNGMPGGTKEQGGDDVTPVKPEGQGDDNNKEYKGKVVDEKGKPVKGVEVILGCEKTDENGLFNCGINPGTLNYDINIDGYQNAKGKLTPGNNTITLTHTDPNGTEEKGGDEEGQGDDNNEEYKGKVVDEKRNPVKGVEVIPGCEKTDKNGLFNCGINPGTLNYDINIDGYQNAKGKLTPGNNTITLTHTDPNGTEEKGDSAVPEKCKDLSGDELKCCKEGKTKNEQTGKYCDGEKINHEDIEPLQGKIPPLVPLPTGVKTELANAKTPCDQRTTDEQVAMIATGAENGGDPFYIKYCRKFYGDDKVEEIINWWKESIIFYTDGFSEGKKKAVFKKTHCFGEYCEIKASKEDITRDGICDSEKIKALYKRLKNGDQTVHSDIDKLSSEEGKKCFDVVNNTDEDGDDTDEEEKPCNDQEVEHIIKEFARVTTDEQDNKKIVVDVTYITCTVDKTQWDKQCPQGYRSNVVQSGDEITITCSKKTNGDGDKEQSVDCNSEEVKNKRKEIEKAEVGDGKTVSYPKSIERCTETAIGEWEKRNKEYAKEQKLKDLEFSKSGPDKKGIITITVKINKNCPEDSDGTYPKCICKDEDMKYDPVKNKCVVDELKKKQKAYDEAKAKEQSKENRTLTALTTAATGIGGMELAMGLAQQAAGAYAEQSMAAYLATMRCTYGRTQQVKAGPDEIELPGGNDSELMKLRTEYFALAKDLKERKEALGMKPGIESEEILDKTQTGLYDDENLGITAGAYASLYRAQMLGSEIDQQRIEDERQEAKNRVIAGGVLVGAGIVGGMVGNSIINGKLGEKIKENKEKRKTKSKRVLDRNVDIKNISKEDIKSSFKRHNLTKQQQAYVDDVLEEAQ